MHVREDLERGTENLKVTRAASKKMAARCLFPAFSLTTRHCTTWIENII